MLLHLMDISRVFKNKFYRANCLKHHFVNRLHHIIMSTFILDSSGDGLSTAGIIGIVCAAGLVTVGIIIAVGILVKCLKG